jgi:lysophospholipase L1-like esterase
MKYLLLSFIAWLYAASTLTAQDPARFAKEISEQTQRLPQGKKCNIVFTGSSSIRLWADLQERFPQTALVNTGFGGSHMSDLLHFAQECVIRFQPGKVFIYEGDNDTADGEKAEAIIREADALVTLLRKHLPRKTRIYFISPKPSPSRWHLKAAYENINSAFAAFCKTKKRVTFIDVWTPMLDERGVVRSELFLEDRLHMNAKGYDIWQRVIQQFL